MESDFFWRSPDILEGIGEARAQALLQADVRSIADMLARGPHAIHKLLPGNSPKQIVRWHAAALLLRVDDVDPQLAEAFVDNGIYTIKQLATRGLQTVEEAIESAQAAGKISAVPSLYALAGMQRSAMALRETGIAQGRVLSVDTGSPLVEARVTCAGIATETDTDGRFFLASVPTDNYTAKLEMPNLGRLSLALEVRTGPHVPLVTYHLPMSKRTPRPRISESEGGIVWLGRGSRLRIIDIELNALPDDTHVLVSYIRQDGTARLLNLYRHKVNEEVRTERVYAGPELLPENTQAGDVLHYSGGALTRTDLTLLEIARRRLHPIIGDSALTPRRRIVHRRLGG